MELFARYDMARTAILYVQKEGQTGLLMVPIDMVEHIRWEKDCRMEPLVQFRLTGDAFNDGYSNGLTLRGSKHTRDMRIAGQQCAGDCIETTLTDGRGHTFLHRLTMDRATDTVRTSVTLRNDTAEQMTVEMLSSFALGSLSPFDTAESDVYLHRFQSYWSAEGRHRCDSIYDLHLERAWATSAVRCEHYGSVGSMPVRGYFPFGAVEDRRHGVIWAAQLAHPSSWQMEFAMQDDSLGFSGGQADRDYGHWRKHLAPGESYCTPEAILTVARDTLDAACQKLTAQQLQTFLDAAPAGEKDLPVAFNEFCTTWGNPTLENIKRIADRLEGRGVRYLVIDCGWYGHEGWWGCMGDWEPDPLLFPNGLKEAADYIRQKGMIPGLWFEMETVGVRAKAYANEEHLLTRDGVTITVGTRRFWNMADPWVQDYLAERVIGQLRAGGFGYLKVDYNNSIGIGCDGFESLGEGLRRNMAATQDFFRRIKAELPDLVIENCASGGHRLEPSMMALVSQASFSDAHETPSIPVIAANLHRLIHPAQSQIWAVLRKKDTAQRLYYSMTNTFLGRMCISGDVFDLEPWQMDIMQQGIDFYHRVADIILWGESRRLGPELQSYNRLTGWQGMLRVKGAQALYIVHAYGETQTIPIPEGWHIQDSYGSPDICPSEDARILFVTAPAQQCAKVFLLKKQ